MNVQTPHRGPETTMLRPLDGSRCTSAHEHAFPVQSPAMGEPLVRARAATPGDVRLAIEAVSTGSNSYRRSSVAERARLCHATGVAVDLANEQGKPLGEVGVINPWNSPLAMVAPWVETTP